MHVGALPYLFAHNIDVRVIATSPVTKIGAQAMHELFIQRKECPTATQQYEDQDTYLEILPPFTI